MQSGRAGSQGRRRGCQMLCPTAQKNPGFRLSSRIVSPTIEMTGIRVVFHPEITLQLLASASQEHLKGAWEGAMMRILLRLNSSELESLI